MSRVTANFNIGDVVGLKCGGHPMVVTNTYVDEDDDNVILIEVAYMDSHGIVHDIVYNQDIFERRAK